MSPSDVPAGAAVTAAAFGAPVGTSQHAWLRRRMLHMQQTDPGGAWVAEDGGEVVGAALAIIREDVWGLSLLVVHPDRHARGTGGRLLQAALEYGRLAAGGIILSSSDPKAMRLYHRASFDLRPCVALGGIADRTKIPADLLAQPTTDVEQMGPLGRLVRGAAYAPADLQLVLERPGAGAFLVPGRGFAIHVEGSVKLLVADGGGIGQDLLWSCLAAGPRGGTVNVEFITAGQDWAVEAGLEAGLALTPDGPVFTRGELGPLRAWLPSGSLL
jgi:predicted N-acetyltransferase YhbS